MICLFKRLLCLLLAVLTVVSCSALAASETPAPVPVDVNGVRLATPNTVVDNGTAYISAYYVASALCPDTVASWEDGMILQGTGYKMTVQSGAKYIVMNGRYLYVPGGVRRHESGDLLVPARVLGKAFGVGVWAYEGVVYLYGEVTPLMSGEEYYNASDVDLISRVVHHESGNQPLAGKIGVANCILNRVYSPIFPNSVYEVLFQKNQFTGATNATPSGESIIAAKLALDGANTVGGACWFNGVGKPCWASRNKNLIITIGGHAFYG